MCEVNKSNLQSFLLLCFLFLHAPRMLPGVMACSCAGPASGGGTGTEIAAKVRENPNNWIHIVFRGIILEETTYSQEVNFRRDEIWNAEFQNVTFSVDEILFNSDPTGSLPPNVFVGDDGNMTASTSTMTECCMCGLTIRGTGGEEYLVQLSTHSPETLNNCDVTCSFGDEYSGRICNDTANALRQENGNAELFNSADREQELDVMEEDDALSSGTSLFFLHVHAFLGVVLLVCEIIFALE